MTIAAHRREGEIEQGPSSDERVTSGRSRSPLSAVNIGERSREMLSAAIVIRGPVREPRETLLDRTHCRNTNYPSSSAIASRRRRPSVSKPRCFDTSPRSTKICIETSLENEIDEMRTRSARQPTNTRTHIE